MSNQRISLLNEQPVVVHSADVIGVVSSDGSAYKLELGNIVPPIASFGGQQEIWITASRPDGLIGDGSQRNPFDGSSAAKFDALMASLGSGVTVHLGQGTFQTNGTSAWLLQNQMRILGSGMYQTTLKMISMPADGSQYAAIAPGSLSTGGINCEFRDFTVDCNFGPLYTALQTAIGHLPADVSVYAISARSGIMHNIRAINAGGVNETFVLSFSAFGPQDFGATAPKRCEISNCRVELPDPSHHNLTAIIINAGYFESAAIPSVDVNCYGGVAVIKNCYVDGSGVTNGINIGYQMGGFRSGLVEGNSSRNVRYAFFHDTFPNYSLDIVLNNFTSDDAGILFNGGGNNQTRNGRISGNILQVAYTGIELNSASYMDVCNNYIYGAGTLILINGQSGHGGGISNTFHDNIVGSSFVSAGLDTDVVRYGNRHIDGTSILSMPDTSDVTFSANSVYVDKVTGVDANGLRQYKSAPFKTLNAAITASSAGDTVYVVRGTFDERMAAKNGVTVRFLPSSQLNISTVSGIAYSTATNQTFTIWHDHADMLMSTSGQLAIFCGHSGAAINVHGNIHHSGAGSNPIALISTDGTIEIWGNVLCDNSYAIGNFSGTSGLVIVHGNVTSTSSVAISIQRGSVRVDSGLIKGTTAVEVYADFCDHVYRNCTLVSTDSTKEAVKFNTVGSHIPIFRNCVLVSGATATKAMNAASAQTVMLYGETVANKGANPPANVTFQGGGTYAVDSNVISDL